MVNRGVTSGYFARASDFADRAMFRDSFVESNRLDERSKSARGEINLALKVQRQIVRELGRSWEREPLGGNPQWLVLEEIMFRLDDVRRAIKLDVIAPYRPIFARVANRVGPWFPLGPNNINGRVKSHRDASHEQQYPFRRRGQRRRLALDQRWRLMVYALEI